MKKALRVFILFSLSVAMLLPLVSCSDPSGGDETSSPDTSEATTVPDEDVPDLEIVKDGRSEFYIVRPENEKAVTEINVAMSLNKAFSAATGGYIGISTDWEKLTVHDNEICVGELKRNGKYYDLDVSSLADDQFIAKVIGTRLILTGKSPMAVKKAVEWFIGEYLAADDGSIKNVTVPGNLEYIGKYDLTPTIRIMTQNLLAGDDEYIEKMKEESYADRCTVDIKEHTVVKRQPRVLSLISTYSPTSLGVQECSNVWRSYFDANLRTIGYKRIGASKNQKIGIVYDTATVTPIANGSIWLTEEPETMKISVKWKATSERLAMYVVFEVNATGQRYIHFNTHVATQEGDNVQLHQAEVLAEYVREIRAKYDNIPAFITGDFNCKSDSNTYKAIVNGDITDCKYAALDSVGAGSFNKFIGQDYANLPIDQVLSSVSGVDSVETYRVVYDRFDGKYASDHYAVYADVILKK